MRTPSEPVAMLSEFAAVFFVGFGFGRYSAAGVQGSSTVSPCMQNTPAYSGFMTPPTMFPKLERLPDRRARVKPANDVGDAPPKHTGI